MLLTVPLPLSMTYHIGSLHSTPCCSIMAPGAKSTKPSLARASSRRSMRRSGASKGTSSSNLAYSLTFGLSLRKALKSFLEMA